MPRLPGSAPLLKEIGRRLRHYRQALEPPMSQERLADAVGVHQTYIGHVERGETNPTAYSLIRIAAVLGIDPGEFIKGLRP